jgi:membrane-associated phospholipid phosphatase
MFTGYYRLIMALAIKLPKNAAKQAKAACRPEPMGLAYQLGWSTLAVAIPIAISIFLASGLTVVAGTMLPLLMLLPMLLGAHYTYRFRSPDYKISDATGGLALMVGAAIIAGLISNAGLALRMPLIDKPLATLDAMMGLGTGEGHIVTWFFGLGGLNQILEYAYVSSVPLCLMLMLALVLAGKRKAAWEAASSFSIAILFCSVVSAFFPAVGNIPHAGLKELAALSLPEGSGTYHLEVFNAFFNGNATELDMGKLVGVVTFPSFHLVMGLVIARAAWPFPMLKWPGLIWAIMIAISTIPIGGHYLVDLIAGGVVWLAIIALFQGVIAKDVVAE